MKHAHRLRNAALAAMAALAGLLAQSAVAALPEPDAIYYGKLSLDGFPLSAGQVVTAQVAADVLDAYTMGSIPGLGGAVTGEGNFYRLRIGLEHLLAGDPPSPGIGSLGTQAIVYVDGGPVAVVFIGGRGGVTRLDIAGSSSFGLTDGDSDGTLDIADNCPAMANDQN